MGHRVLGLVLGRSAVLGGGLGRRSGGSERGDRHGLIVRSRAGEAVLVHVVGQVGHVDRGCTDLVRLLVPLTVGGEFGTAACDCETVDALGRHGVVRHGVVRHGGGLVRRVLTGLVGLVGNGHRVVHGGDCGLVDRRLGALVRPGAVRRGPLGDLPPQGDGGEAHGGAALQVTVVRLRLRRGLRLRLRRGLRLCLRLLGRRGSGRLKLEPAGRKRRYGRGRSRVRGRRRGGHGLRLGSHLRFNLNLGLGFRPRLRLLRLESAPDRQPGQPGRPPGRRRGRSEGCPRTRRRRRSERGPRSRPRRRRERRPRGRGRNGGGAVGRSRVRRRSQPRQRRNRPTRSRRSGRSGSIGGPGARARPLPRPLPLALVLSLPLPRIARRVLRVPGGRGVVDGELARRLDCGLRVGLVIAGCSPAPADPVPIAAHSSSWCGRAPSCRAGATVFVVRRCPSETRSSDRRPSPYDADARSTGSGVAPGPSLITTRPTPAAPSSPQHLPIASQPAPKCRTSFPNPCMRDATSMNKSDRTSPERRPEPTVPNPTVPTGDQDPA